MHWNTISQLCKHRSKSQVALDFMDLAMELQEV